MKPPALPVPGNGVFLDDQNRLHYEGEITAQNSEMLFALWSSSEPRPGTLIIDSQGGSVMPGMDIGEWVFENNITVVVAGACVSSCANYVFTAARQKMLHRDSILVWHGSSWQKNMDEQFREGVDSIVEWRNREVAFFSHIGVDYRITTYGEDYTFGDYAHAVFTREPILGFDYSIEDMAKFGVSNIQLVDGEWAWRNYTDCCNVKRVQVNGELP